MIDGRKKWQGKSAPDAERNYGKARMPIAYPIVSPFMDEPKRQTLTPYQKACKALDEAEA